MLDGGLIGKQFTRDFFFQVTGFLNIPCVVVLCVMRVCLVFVLIVRVMINNGNIENFLMQICL